MVRPVSLVVDTYDAYAPRGAVPAVVPWGAALATGLGAMGAGAEAGFGATIVVIVPFTSFFCFVDDVGIGRRSDPARRYRMRRARGIDVQLVVALFAGG